MRMKHSGFQVVRAALLLVFDEIVLVPRVGVSLLCPAPINATQSKAPLRQ